MLLGVCSQESCVLKKQEPQLVMGIGKRCSFPGRDSAGDNRATRKVEEDALKGASKLRGGGDLLPSHCEKEGVLRSQGRIHARVLSHMTPPDNGK